MARSINKPQLIKADVQFYVNHKKVMFSVVHNLPDRFGESFDCALENWLARTERHTAKSFCDYVMNKQGAYTCMTIETFNKLFHNN